MKVKRERGAEVAERWRERLARFRKLGCSITAFCLREGISQPSFFHWRRRLAAECASSDGHRVGRAFLPVEVVEHSGHTRASEGIEDSWMQITIGTVRMRVPASIDEAALRRLLRVVREEVGTC